MSILDQSIAQPHTSCHYTSSYFSWCLWHVHYGDKIGGVFVLQTQERNSYWCVLYDLVPAKLLTPIPHCSLIFCRTTFAASWFCWRHIFKHNAQYFRMPLLMIFTFLLYKTCYILLLRFHRSLTQYHLHRDCVAKLYFPSSSAQTIRGCSTATWAYHLPRDESMLGC